MRKEELFFEMDQKNSEFEKMSDTIWQYAEPAFQEYQSSKLQREFLEKKGFRITAPVGGMDTAFIAEYGEGSPVIAVLGEYDALPGLSQEADIMMQQPIEGAAAGHGCGHHLLGTAGVETVCAVKTQMDAGKVSGTIRYYGCPAEEGGGGKVFLIRSGVFDDVDIAISWHPFAAAGFMEHTLSVVISKFEFKGIAAHAADAPHLGRSALDAAELMNIGTQFLREHITSDCRIHYSFLDAGGPKPNIVQDHAELRYVVRSDDLASTREVFERICKIAKGAAMMTETTVCDPVITGAYANMIPNETLKKICMDAFDRLLPYDFSQEENYGRTFNKIVSGNDRSYLNMFTSRIQSGSTDFSDVSWVVPSICISSPCYTADTQLHNWAATAQGKSDAAHKGMHLAAKVMASCAMDIFENPAVAEEAKKELSQRLDGKVYKSLLPEDAAPPKQ